jgi:hypothetical protein
MNTQHLRKGAQGSKLAERGTVHLFDLHLLEFAMLL